MSETNDIQMFPSRPYKIVGLVKFATSREDFEKLAKGLIEKVKAEPEKFSLSFDQILVLGRVSGHDIFEVRFIKFEDEQTVLQTDNGNPG